MAASVERFMKQLLSPKQVAASIGVSESSLKRWCDQGVVRTERTPGGHRRIRLGEVLRFLREQSQTLVRPELLGLPSGTGRGPRSIAKAGEALLDALKAGDGDQARRLVFDLFLAGNGVARICEELVTPALRAVGDGWACGTVQIYQEHRACELLNRVLYELRQILPPSPPDAPLAMGGTPPGDQYRLATLMVELVLVDQGWNAVSLGSSLPYTTLAAAARIDRPALFWLSYTVPEPLEVSQAGIAEILAAAPESTTVVLGGQCLDPILGEVDPRVHHLGSLSALRELVQQLRPERVATAESVTD
jgi:MerR family transcriptional regulator, light-induced transcriptional regulator